jgi:hypothetical protein
VWSKCERIRLTFGLFPLLPFFHGFVNFLFSLPFHALGKGWKCIPFSSHLVKIHKTNHVNFRINQKNGGVGVLSTMSLIHRCIFYSHKNLNNKGKRKQWKKQKTKKWATLDPRLHFGSLNHELSFKLFFWFRPIGFPSKMMPRTLNHNLICVGPGSLFKGLGTNLKFLNNRTTWFHWTPLLGTLSTMAMNICQCKRWEWKNAFVFCMWKIIMMESFRYHPWSSIPLSPKNKDTNKENAKHACTK